jgi:hypothetical protein
MASAAEMTAAEVSTVEAAAIEVTTATEEEAAAD